MITFTSLGRKGNLGNQLFQIASTVGIAKKNAQDYVFPKWDYATYFKFDFPFSDNLSHAKFSQIVEKSYSFYDWKLTDGDFDVNGVLQSEKYFDILKTKEIFEFKEEFLKSIQKKHQHLFDKKTIFISVRRGDFVGHPHYYQLSYKYYFLALINNFPDWEERNLIFMSDDIKYCKYHFSDFKNTFFLENASAIEQLAISTYGDDFIISNSSFSWWMAWLAEKNETKIIRPIKNFRGSFSKINNDNDYFPERWIVFNHKKYFLSLRYFPLIIKGAFYEMIVDVKCASKRVLNLLDKISKKIKR